MEGNSVKMDGTGSFRLSFSSDGETIKEDVIADNIKDVHILFEPDVAIKDRINKIKVHPMA